MINLEIEINLILELIDTRIKTLHEQIQTIQEDELQINKKEEIQELKAICYELLQLRERLLEIERMC